MFVLSIIKDTIPVLPANFGAPPHQALIDEINKKYANRALHDVGLCICVFDLAEAGEGKVRYGDGSLWYKVKFRMVVFRPFISEVILAKVKSSDEDGMRLSVGFFDDMYIPLAYLPHPATFDPNERAHFWLPDSEAKTTHERLESPTSERMYIDQGEIIRVRVEADEFYDDEPGPPKAAEGVAVNREVRRAPYSIICSIAEQGLGPVAWWKSAQADGALMDVA
ncbi:RNA polymerase III subunit Rpc25-domain-containing protein [Melanogaster broomeanus]|nr:RNA polymerase III subunit Rpc25-domain-containing protein [Melanogaster broomeanus]